jgi:hypothetical protein
MSFQVNYAHLYDYDTGKEGISIPVTLKLIDKQTRFHAKIDTGASCCIFERQLGESLGIDIETGIEQRISTATGIFVTYGHDVTLSVFDYEFDSTVYFAQNAAFHRNVLGRVGWLDRVRIGIVDYDGKLYLSSYQD